MNFLICFALKSHIVEFTFRIVKNIRFGKNAVKLKQISDNRI